jgi:toxin ParE1/3/4
LRYQAVDEIRKGYRRSVCGVDSIYYRIKGDDVEIMAIIGQQDIEKIISNE